MFAGTCILKNTIRQKNISCGGIIPQNTSSLYHKIKSIHSLPKQKEYFKTKHVSRALYYIKCVKLESQLTILT